MSIESREIVFDALLTLETTESKSHLLIRDVLSKYDYLDLRDKAFIKNLYEGTISKKITLDYVLNKLSKKPMEKCKPAIRVILRMSAYQILFMDKIPDSASCDEAAKLVKKKSFENFVPFVNGILRNLCDKKEELLSFDCINDKVTRLSVKYSYPEWIVRMFNKEQSDVEALLKAMEEVKPTCVKILDASIEEKLLFLWKEKGINVKKSKFIENAFLLSGFDGLNSVPGFLEGKLLIQDESSMLSSKAGGVKPGCDLTVIDTCAAPGGKSAFIASLMFPKGKVLSFDVSELKVSLIRENMERLGLTNVTTKVFDATVFNPELEETADVVIADVPCSGLGVMARKSDIKYNVSNEAMKDICDLQKAIVSNVFKYVKKGGVFIYSTCTIHKAENEKMVKFIEENLPLKGDSLKPFLPELFSVNREKDYAIQLLPNIDGTDGFFVARFIRE